MNPTDYQNQAAISLPGPSTIVGMVADADALTLRLLYAVCGLAGECAEWLEDVHRGEFDLALGEAGDVLFYVAATCTALKMDLSEIMDGASGDPEADPAEITLRSCEIVNIVQRAIFYGREIGVDMIRLNLAMLVTHLVVLHSVEAIMAASLDRCAKKRRVQR